MPFTALVSTAELARHLDDPRWVVFDCRHDLSDIESGRRAYRESHVPGAHFAHLDQDLSGPLTGKNGRHPLPAPEAFAARLAGLGVDESKQVIAYDASGGIYAARAWWMLRWLGHDRVAVLDGGWEKWLKENRPVSAAAPQPLPAQFKSEIRENRVDVRFVEEHLDSPEMLIIDARSPERFRGIGEVLDPVGGHIPGALNRFFKENLDAQGCFKPAEELRQAFGQLTRGVNPEKIVHQCGSGVTACHNLLAMEIAGLSGSKLYPGSWSEWCSDPARPVAK